RAGVLEVGAAQRNVERGGGEAADGDACAGDVFIRSARIAARGAVVTGRDDDGDALRRCLLPQIVVELNAGRTDVCLAGAEAFAEDRSEVVVDDVDRGKVGAEEAEAGGVFGDDEIDLSARSDGAGP